MRAAIAARAGRLSFPPPVKPCREERQRCAPAPKPPGTRLRDLTRTHYSLGGRGFCRYGRTRLVGSMTGFWVTGSNVMVHWSASLLKR